MAEKIILTANLGEKQESSQGIFYYTGDGTTNLNIKNVAKLDTVFSQEFTGPVTFSGETTVNKLNILGDVTQMGSSFITHAEKVEIRDNMLVLNKGEINSGVTQGISGIEVDRGTLPSYRFVFDETDDCFKVGEPDELQTVATRKGFGPEQSVPLWEPGENTLVPSVVNGEKLGFIRNLTRDAQTQLNEKLNLSGGTMTGSLAINEQLSVYGETAVDKIFSKSGFVSGFGGSGWQIDNSGKAEFGDLIIRGRLQASEFVINKIRATNGSVWVSDSSIIKSVSKSGSVYTATISSPVFAGGDILMCKRPDKEYKAIVTIVSESTIKFAANGLVEEGDELVRIGNTKDTNRQGAVYMTSSDSGAPFIDILDKVNTVTYANKTVARMGKLTGISDTVFPGISGYGLYSNNAYLKGDFVLRNGKTIAEFTKDEITLSTDNIQIGGRNLFLDSTTRICNNTPTSFFYQNSDNRPFALGFTELTGKTVTISFDCEVSNIPDFSGFNIGVQIFARYANGGSLSHLLGITNSALENGSYKGRLSGTFDIAEGELKPLEEEVQFLAIVNHLNGTTGLDGANPVSVKIENIKVERGNKATGWTPAPEDKADVEKLKSAGINLKEGTITLSASDKTKVEALLPDGSKKEVAVFEVKEDGNPVLRSSMVDVETLLAGNVISNLIKTNGLNVNNNTSIDANGVLTSINGTFRNINAMSGQIGKFNIKTDNLTHEFTNEEGNRSYSTVLASPKISFISKEEYGYISIGVGENLSGIGRTFIDLYSQPDSWAPLISGINLNLKESGAFDGIHCKIEKSGGIGTAKGIVIETTNPKDDIALEATGRVRFYNVRDIANENAIYNLQLYAQSAGNGNFYIMGKSV